VVDLEDAVIDVVDLKIAGERLRRRVDQDAVGLGVDEQ
jgi:hypothetical protein